MITDEDAKEIIETLRALAGRNAKERGKYNHEYWKGQSDGRAGAYNLAAAWLEQIIHEEVDDEHRATL